MSPLLSHHRLFLRQFREHFHTTGALAPSSRWLARALARYVSECAGPKRILEVGPGTGAVTQVIVRRMGDKDSLDIVELNASFVELLEGRFDNEPHFAAAAGRSRIVHDRLENLPRDDAYDIIISGLPMNNFAVADVESIFTAFEHLLAPGGTLSLFEYIGVRRQRAVVSGRHERDRLRGIGHVLSERLVPYRIRREAVLRNLPPAWVHHARFRP